MKFLILRFSSIGDIVLTTPVVRCLKRKFPDAEIHYATKRAFQSIVQHNPYISKVHVLDDSIWTFINELKGEKFDYVIDLHHNQRTLIIKLMLGVKSSSFNKLNFAKWLLVNFKINRLPDKHIVDRYLETCSELGVLNDGEGLDYFIPAMDEVNPNVLPHVFASGYIAWVIGAKQNTKKFPFKKIAATLQQINLPIVLLGGKEDAGDGEEICDALKERNIFNACGKFNLNQSASLVKQAKAVVTNDTGLMHIAAAFKKPVISLWGNTVPQFGMYPYFGNNEVPNARFEVLGLSCRPCSKLGYSKCPKGHFKCMNDLNESELAKSATQFYTR